MLFCYIDIENIEFRLLRCNGKHSSKHTNHIEKQNGESNHTFGPCFHIHTATLRYQENGSRIDHFAEQTDKYSDFDSALDYFIKICHFIDSDPAPKPENTIFSYGKSE